MRLPNQCATALYAVCGRHLDASEYRPRLRNGREEPLLPCRQQVRICSDETGDNIDEVVLQLKRWLALGYNPCYDCDCEEMRSIVGPSRDGDDAAGPGPARRACQSRKKHMTLRATTLTRSLTSEELDFISTGLGNFNPDELDCLRD
jgi:hypothetical protein